MSLEYHHETRTQLTAPGLVRLAAFVENSKIYVKIRLWLSFAGSSKSARHKKQQANDIRGVVFEHCLKTRQ
jgi:hypothetical protein